MTEEEIGYKIKLLGTDRKSYHAHPSLFEKLEDLDPGVEEFLVQYAQAISRKLSALIKVVKPFISERVAEDFEDLVENKARRRNDFYTPLLTIKETSELLEWLIEKELVIKTRNGWYKKGKTHGELIW